MTPLPDPDASHQSWIDFVFNSGGQTVGNGCFTQSPHCIHSAGMNQNPSVLDFFWVQNTPAEWLQASCRQPNFALNDL